MTLSARTKLTAGLLTLGVLLLADVHAQFPALDAERAKNFGIAYLEQEQPNDAARMFRDVIESAPDEPLGYANLAASFLRLSKPDSALHWLAVASRVAPDNAHVQYLTSEAYGAQSNWPQVIDALNRAVALSPEDPVARFARFRTIQANGVDSLKATAESDISALVTRLPNNPVIRVKHAQIKAAGGDLDAARESYDVLKPLIQDANVQRRVLALIDRGLKQQNPVLAGRGFTVLENVFRPSERYKQAQESLQNPVVGLPMLHFSAAFQGNLEREVPDRIAVEWSETLSFPAAGDSDRGSLDFADVDGDDLEDALVASAAGSIIHLSGGDRELPEARIGRYVDDNNDGVFDVVLVGNMGPVLFRGDSTGTLTDQTATAELSGNEGLSIAIVDFDNEGDLDLIVGEADGMASWQNRGDGRYRTVNDRTGLSIKGARKILPIDHDDDDDADLVVLDSSGRLVFYDNLRLSRFGAVERGLGEGAYVDVWRVDFDNNGELDLLALSESGNLDLRRWDGRRYSEAIAISSGLDGAIEDATPADLDNDGWADIVLGHADGLSWLRNSGSGAWDLAAITTESMQILDLDVSDADNDGDSDVFALTADGRVRGFENNGGNANRWLRVSLVGLQTRGTKNNVHGLGSRIEIKAGLHFQVLYADRPVTHFGLGSRQQADLVRVTWSNGVPQNVFEPETNQTIREKQVLKGSCPYLYVWDGERFQFVTDLLGAAPLGLQLADGVIAPDNPREIVKVDAKWMKEKDGAFVFQFTEELWETIYLDEVGLWVVDHPEDVEAFTDERFVPPPYADLEVATTRGRVYPEKALNTDGEDVTSTMLAYDYVYPNTFTPTRYQGLVEPHTLTLQFGDVSDMDSPTLVMRGWIFWTDTSINVNLSQGEAVRPEFPMIDVWRNGEWVTQDRPLGLPKGKDKWIVLDLAGLVDPSDARVRIRTNYQIYYDTAFLADAVADPATRVTRLKASSADLHYGGFSEMVRPAPEAPHHYDYAKKVSLPVWKDMNGLATRYGDVTDLLEETDDLMIVFTAGDEVTLKFNADELPKLGQGMARSYFFLSDGWDKDSDRNTVEGLTVLPLPYHGMKSYPYSEGDAFPNTEAHQRMIRETLTRKIGPEAYRDYLRSQVFTSKPESLPWAKTKHIAEGGKE